jgi:hypothetical protein
MVKILQDAKVHIIITSTCLIIQIAFVNKMEYSEVSVNEELLTVKS